MPTSFTPEQLQEIQQMIQQGAFGPGGRSPIRDRQLHDLRLVPTATDPRPLFLPSAEAPRDAPPYVRTTWPSLRWHKETGQEITVTNDQQAATLGPEWVQTPPGAVALDPLAGMQDALAALTPKERDAIFANQKRLRLDKLQAALAALSDDDLAALLESAKPKVEETKTA